MDSKPYNLVIHCNMLLGNTGCIYQTWTTAAGEQPGTFGHPRFLVGGGKTFENNEYIKITINLKILLS
jgi:hypothetical protein